MDKDERNQEFERRITALEHVVWGQDYKEGLRAELREFIKTTEENFRELNKKIEGLQTFKAKILGALALLAVLQPILIVLLQHWLHTPA